MQILNIVLILLAFIADFYCDFFLEHLEYSLKSTKISIFLLKFQL